MTQKVGVGKNDPVLTERVRVGVHNTRILISRFRSSFGHLPLLYLPPVQRSLPLDIPQISSTCHKDIIVRRSVEQPKIEGGMAGRELGQTFKNESLCPQRRRPIHPLSGFPLPSLSLSLE